MQFHRAIAVLAVAVSCIGAADAQIFSEKNINGKTVSCMHSGLYSDLEDCGARSYWYAYVFIGSIAAVTPAASDEVELRIIPEEVFSGRPETPLTVLTSQGLCLPKLVVGERWLFYLRKEKDKPIVLDYYGNDSRPVTDSQKQIATLRRLQKIGDFALLRGEVAGDKFSQKPGLPNAQVFATRQADKKRFASITDADGRYEFQPLLPGKYNVTVGPVGPLQPDDSEIDLKGGACWDLTLSRSPHARISGHVRRSNGSPASNVDVVLIRSDNSGYLTTQTNKDGYFRFDSQEPGEFVVGFNFPARADWINGASAGAAVELPPASLFYPVGSNRSNARVIQLHTDEKVDTIDVTLPAR